VIMACFETVGLVVDPSRASVSKVASSITISFEVACLHEVSAFSE